MCCTSPNSVSQCLIRLLEDIGRQLPADISGGVGKQFSGIYWGLRRNKAMGDSTQTEFFRVAFLDFAMNHWGRGYVDHKIIQYLGGIGSKRFLTQTEFAAKIGVQQSTAARLLNNSSLASKRVKCGAADRIVVDTEELSIPRTWPGKIYGVRVAAKRLGRIHPQGNEEFWHLRGEPSAANASRLP
jgi:hypothetical protein